MMDIDVGHCEHCAHWHRPDGWENDDYPWSAYGVCDAFNDNDIVCIYLESEGYENKAILSTRKDFGCILWEAKAESRSGLTPGGHKDDLTVSIGAF